MKLLRHGMLIGQIGIFLLGICGSIYVSLTPANSMMNWYSIDDAFYYYKVAQNVLTGHGFTFDQINLTNGFHPLWMVICLGVFWLSRFNLLLPLRVLILVSGILNGLTGVSTFPVVKESTSSFGGGDRRVCVDAFAGNFQHNHCARHGSFHQRILLNLVPDPGCEISCSCERIQSEEIRNYCLPG